MMSQEHKENVVFNQPTITPKAYISKSSAGWPETFDRKKADAELVKFVAPANVHELVELFIAQRELGEKHADRIIAWHTILGFLGRTMSVRFDFVPQLAAIAFWGHVVLAQQQEGN